MRKMELKLEELDVDTFDTTAAEPAGRGTVQGHWSFAGTCDAATCQQGGTCAASCKCTDDPRACL